MRASLCLLTLAGLALAQEDSYVLPDFSTTIILPTWPGSQIVLSTLTVPNAPAATGTTLSTVTLVDSSTLVSVSGTSTSTVAVGTLFPMPTVVSPTLPTFSVPVPVATAAAMKEALPGSVAGLLALGAAAVALF